MIQNRVVDLCVKLSRCTCVLARCRADVEGVKQLVGGFKEHLVHPAT